MIFPIFGTFNLILAEELDQTIVLNEEINPNSTKSANLSQHISSAGRLNSFSNPNFISQLISMYRYDFKYYNKSMSILQYIISQHIFSIVRKILWIP
jgi:hypothetical protein